MLLKAMLCYVIEGYVMLCYDVIQHGTGGAAIMESSYKGEITKYFEKRFLRLQRKWQEQTRMLMEKSVSQSW